ncbi:Cysteine desulfurase [Bacillus sp. THAF10]|uniref:cysteine desulfurase family protein n=1 Tax=Bacillus sp. THAF10 TaxID=2587848 RepID=UPI001267AED6|nr:cysteine desulfurase family protein [Bacillus sp. THAF10]QFT90196.1 Cysteine desulfurase [Bacillus sp. THAF10]
MIYLDNSATTKPYQEVLDSFLTVSTDFFANPSSLHSLGGKAEKLLHRSRENIASLLGVDDKEVIFTSGGTESNNLAIKGTAMAKKHLGKHLITTSIEHPSVHFAFQSLEKDGFQVTYLPVDTSGKVTPQQVEAAITTETILVSVMHVNNETGVIQPIESIAEHVAKYPRVTLHVDYVQGIGKVPLSLTNIDLCTMSAHKFHGLKGTGMLIAKAGTKLTPLQHGGEQEWELRSGTENVAGIVAMTKALRMTLEASGKSQSHMEALKNFCISELLNIPAVHVNTPVHHSAPHIVNFSIPGLKSEVLVHTLGNKNIFVSTTSACSSKRKTPSRTLTAMGTTQAIADSSIRISMNAETTKDEIEEFLKELKNAIYTIKEVMR